MQAVLSGPIVTDYVPAARPPWVLLALAVGLLAFVVPRDVLPEFLIGSLLAAGVGLVVNWFSEPQANGPA